LVANIVERLEIEVDTSGRNMILPNAFQH